MIAAESDSSLIRKKWPKRALWTLGALVLIYVFPFGVVDGYTDRARVSELIVVSGGAREKVEEALLKGTSHKVTLDAASLIPESLGLKSKDGEKIEIAYREINENGEIKVFASELGVFIIFTPTLNGTKVVWSCWGRPLKLVPKSCNGKI